MEYGILDNRTQGKVIDKLKEDLKSGTKVSIISAYFTIFAYQELRKELNKIDSLRLLFSMPTFVENKKDINREFKLSGSYESGLAGDRYEMKLKNELKQSEIAKECAEWIRKKVEVRAYDEEHALPQKMYIMEQNESENSYIVGSADFTSSGLGIVPSNKIEMNSYEKNTNSTQMWLMQFNMLWNNNEKVKDVKKALLNSLEVVYKENTSEFIYFVTLYNIFKDYLNELTEEEIVKSKTGFKGSIVWNKLYNFQKDGVLGAIDKLEKYNGCILADSVGLGKTFEALAIIKYYELRNNRVLVLCPKKLRENWLTYRANRRDNILEKDRLNYDVLNHTDLSRYTGYSGDINLEEIYWENYDLIVIDESHNFRNNNNSKDNKETRYSRLLNQIIKKGIKTNCTLIFSPGQALLAAKAGATYVSPFLGRLDDISTDGLALIEDIRIIFDNYGYDTEILAASIRHSMHIINCAKIGADVITSPLAPILSLLKHPLTDNGLAQFVADSKKLI